MLEGPFITNPIFSFESTDAWQKHFHIGYKIEIGLNDDYVEGEENEYEQYVVTRTELYNRHLSIELYEEIERHPDVQAINITKEQFDEIQKIIDSHSELIRVNSNLSSSCLGICDGSMNDIYFSSLKFNRRIECSNIMHFNHLNIEHSQFLNEYEQRDALQSKIVANAIKDVFDLLNKYNIKFKEVDENKYGF